MLGDPLPHLLLGDTSPHPQEPRSRRSPPLELAGWKIRGVMGVMRSGGV